MKRHMAVAVAAVTFIAGIALGVAYKVLTAGPPTMRCYLVNGTTLQSGYDAYGSQTVQDETCSVKFLNTSPTSVQITDPAGRHTWYTLTAGQ